MVSAGTASFSGYFYLDDFHINRRLYYNITVKAKLRSPRTVASEMLQETFF